jgi:peptidoglycan hydrolase CwlO-like protein
MNATLKRLDEKEEEVNDLNNRIKEMGYEIQQLQNHIAIYN